MSAHVHQWKFQHRTGGVHRFRCDCGAWGWRSRLFGQRDIRPYANGRKFDDWLREEDITARPETFRGGRVDSKPTLDDYDRGTPW